MKRKTNSFLDYIEAAETFPVGNELHHYYTVTLGYENHVYQELKKYGRRVFMTDRPHAQILEVSPFCLTTKI